MKIPPKQTVIVAALALTLALSVTAHGADISSAEARAIAKEAYIYGFPLVDNYRIEYDYFVDTKGPEFKAPWRHIANIPRVTRATDTHDYKYPAAAFEDIPIVSPSWRPHMLAASMLHIPAPTVPESQIIQPAREAVAGL